MDLIQYVASLPSVKITRLYENEFTCLAIFRSLSPLAKQYVYRLIFLEDAIPIAFLASWAVPSATSKHNAAIDMLLRLRLFEAPPKQTEPAYILNRSFRDHVRASISSGVGRQVATVPIEVLEAAPSKERIEEFAAMQWENLLLFAVGGGSCPEPPIELRETKPLDIGALMLKAGLIKIDGATQRQTVTQQGFRFLLADTYSQLWQLLREYVVNAEEQSSAELASVLGFLLQLGFQGEQPMRCSGLSPIQLDIAAHMAQLGVLLPFRALREVWLRPTRLAMLLASGAGGGGGSASALEDGFVVVETNYRVYAYTSSPVRQAILRLFVRCDVLLPNLFVGTITRESAVSALEHGVDAEQIIGYLRQHAHPRVATRVPIVPGVVADQIRLWERELQRLQAQQGVLYKNFEGDDLYRQVAAFAEKIGGCLLRDNSKREFVAAAHIHEQVRSQIKLLKKELGYGG